MSISTSLVSELEKAENKKIGFIFCVCTGKCPGFSKMDMWDFINIVRAEYPVEYAFIHPMLCDEDGERFLAEFLKKDRKYLVAGCAPIMQKKLFKDSFAKAGLDVNKDLIPIDARNMTTQEALALVKKTLEETAR
jgi:heterodisulfide reductase subunit A-like polyferredoxin